MGNVLHLEMLFGLNVSSRCLMFSAFSCWKAETDILLSCTDTSFDPQLSSSPFTSNNNLFLTVDIWLLLYGSYCLVMSSKQFSYWRVAIQLSSQLQPLLDSTKSDLDLLCFFFEQTLSYNNKM